MNSLGDILIFFFEFREGFSSLENAITQMTALSHSHWIFNGYNKSGSTFVFENHSSSYGFDTTIFWSLPGCGAFFVEILYLF